MREYIVRMPSDMPYEIKAELSAWYVNSEPIVRCRDCIHFDSRPGYQLCRRDMSCDELAVYAEPDGFCKWGERREIV